MSEHPDTARLTWLEEMGAQVTIPADDALKATTYLVHTNFTGWVEGANLREAIDNARRQLEEGGQ